jgi:hypothetical protein
LAAPKEIVDLVERFESNLESDKSGHYNETQVRREFVDPFFKALGWDIDNEQGFAEAYKNVIHEDAIKVGTTHQSPRLLFSYPARGTWRMCAIAGLGFYGSLTSSTELRLGSILYYCSSFLGRQSINNLSISNVS